MCTAFIEWMRQYDGWTCYAETAGWDILLAHRDGIQIGVQAKLKFNLAVIEQAIEPKYYGRGTGDTGPDFRAVLVPKYDYGYLREVLGLNAITAQKRWQDGAITFTFNDGDHLAHWQNWHFANPVKRHPLPEYVPDVQAGVPSPVTLTKWKIAALEICAIIELRGHCTRDDFRVVGIDHRRWTALWLEPLSDTPGAFRWSKKAGNINFAKQHPEVYPQILKKIEARLGRQTTRTEESVR